MVAQWPELRKLTELRAAYQKYSLESKETAKTILNSTEPDVVEVKSILATLSSQMVKIRDLNSRIQSIVKKDIFQWRNEVATVVDFNLLWITHLRDLRRKCEASAKNLRERGSTLSLDIDEIHKAIEMLSEKEMLPRTPSNENVAEKENEKNDKQKWQENQKSSYHTKQPEAPEQLKKQFDAAQQQNVGIALDSKAQTDSKKERKQSDPKKQRKQSDSKKQRKASETKKQRKQSDSKKQRKQSDSKKQRKESESKKQTSIITDVKNVIMTDVAGSLLRRLQPKNPVSRDVTVLHTTSQRPLSWAPGIEIRIIPATPPVARRTSCLSRKGSNVGDRYIYDHGDINQVVKGIRDIAERGVRRRKLKTVRWSMDLDQVQAA